MNPRIAKEIRVQLLPFGLLVIAAMLPLWMLFDAPGSVMIPAYAVVALVMGSLAFGVEFQHRTLSGFLVQPIGRTILWKEKMWVLGSVLGLGTVLMALLVRYFDPRLLTTTHRWQVFIVISACAGCGGPFWTLLLRGSLMGTALGFLAPASLVMLFWWSFGKMYPGHEFQPEHVTTILLFDSASTLILGFRQFRKLEAFDGPTPSPEVELPAAVGTFFSKPFEALARPFAGPFTSLVRKEFRLQQLCFLFAAVFSVPVMLVITLHGGHLDWKGQSSFCEMSIVGGFGIYMGILPVLAGSLSLAEEKSWGVSEWHLTLSPAVRKQWFAKMLVTFGISFVLGLLFPGLLLWIGKGWPFSNNPGSLVGITFQALMVPIIQLMLTSLSIYASSLVAGTIRAMLVCTGMLFAMSPLIRFGSLIGNQYRRTADNFFITFDWSETLIILGGYMSLAAIGVVCLLQVFSFMGFRFQRFPARQVGLQLAILSAVILIISVGLGTLGFE